MNVLERLLEAASKVTTEIGGLLALPAPGSPITIEGKATPLTPAATPPLAQQLDIDSVGNIPRFMTSAQAAA